MRAALRRAAPTTAKAVIITDAFTVDLSAKRVTTASGEVRLTPTETSGGGLTMTVTLPCAAAAPTGSRP